MIKASWGLGNRVKVTLGIGLTRDRFTSGCWL